MRSLQSAFRRGGSAQDSSRYRHIQASGSGEPGFLMLKRSPPSGAATAVVRHSDGRSRNCWRKSSVAQIWPGFDQRLDARRAQDRIAADDDGALARAAPVGLHRPVVQRDAQARMTGCLVDRVHQVPRRLRQRDRIVGGDQGRVAGPDLDDRGGRRPARPLPRRRRGPAVEPGAHERAEALHVGLQHAALAQVDGVRSTGPDSRQGRS